MLPPKTYKTSLDVLRHRLVLSFEAEAQNVTSDKLIDTLIEQVPVLDHADRKTISPDHHGSLRSLNDLLSLDIGYQAPQKRHQLKNGKSERDKIIQIQWKGH